MSFAARLVIAGIGTAGLLGVLFLYAGIYDIAATSPHYPWTRKVLEIGMMQSVRSHAKSVQSVPDLTDRRRIDRGLRYFDVGCTPCHGAPGTMPAGLGTSLLPVAPDLSLQVSHFNERELFWIVKHGIKMTGMPSWETQQRDDEVWDVVAFIRLLPSIDADGYQAMLGVSPNAQAHQRRGWTIAAAGSAGSSPTACIRCHGIDGLGRQPGSFPILAGQDGAYLYKSLQDYAAGLRPSGFMQGVARGLTGDEMADVAEYYAALAADRDSQMDSPDPLALQIGASLAAAGDPRREIEACAACHGAARQAGVPALDGQPADYLALQLRLWKQGVRRGDAGNVMGKIAKAMSETEIGATAVYYSSLAPRTRASAEHAGDTGN